MSTNSRDSSVGTATSYGMEGPAFEFRQGRDSSLLQKSRPMGKATGA
jgi:hypothetical protein